MVNNILTRRQEHGIKQKPMFLWEPVPGVCSPNDWADCIEAMKVVDVISPNINEAASFLGKVIDEELPFGNFKVQVKAIVQDYKSHLAQDGAVVFRCGKHGCLVATISEMMWLPAYHQSKVKVIDPTGGGNAFCGGFCAGWIHSGGDFVAAARYGNIAASFVIEQFGLPRLDHLDGAEFWNMDTAEKRLEFGTNLEMRSDRKIKFVIS
jgi:sugar/nucleoside kinase (ribokinase family)